LKKKYLDSENKKWEVDFSKSEEYFKINSIEFEDDYLSTNFTIQKNDNSSLWIIEDGKKTLARFSRIGDSWWVHYKGKITIWSEMSLATNTNQIEDAGSLIAPMPGKILKMCVNEGENVTSGQDLVLMEAMKMEHRITSPIAGTVTKIHFNEGQQVEQGNLLIEVEEIED
tara:strand:- start:99 stop:608 length:510 start_codon:yes stop_codon:yes gene_type:complete